MKKSKQNLKFWRSREDEGCLQMPSTNWPEESNLQSSADRLIVLKYPKVCKGELILGNF